MSELSESGLQDRLREASYVWSSMSRGLRRETLLDILDLRVCSGCGSVIPKDGPDHTSEECVVAEVMES